MKLGFSAITSSPFYHPAFNAAIFDGPFRIYFVSFHESFALKVYLYLQDIFKVKVPFYKEIARESQKTVMIMLYPTSDSLHRLFKRQFEEGRADDMEALIINPTPVVHEIKGSLFGLSVPLSEANIRQLMEELADVFVSWDQNCVNSPLDAHAEITSLVNWPEARLL